MPAASTSTRRRPQDIALDLEAMRDDLDTDSYQRRLGDGATLWHAAQILRRHARLEEKLTEAAKALVLHAGVLEEDCDSCTDLVNEIVELVGLEHLVEAVTAHRKVAG